MANWLHKTTLKYMVSSDPIDTANWIRNPTLPEGCEDWSWVVVDGDTVRAPSIEERAAITAAKLAEAKHAKMYAIDARTAALVTQGVTVATGKVISTSLAATQNLQNLWIGFQQGIVTLPKTISTADGGTYTISDNADLIRIAGLLRDHQLTHLESGQSLRAQVLACTTLAEVAAVEDAR